MLHYRVTTRYLSTEKNFNICMLYKLWNFEKLMEIFWPPPSPEKGGTEDCIISFEYIMLTS